METKTSTDKKYLDPSEWLLQLAVNPFFKPLTNMRKYAEYRLELAANDSVDFADWLYENYAIVKCSTGKAWVNKKENDIYLNGSDWYNQKLIKFDGKTTKQLFEVFKNK